MKILHYFLGFPPRRTGGLTRYVTDLVKKQAEMGETVYTLSPGLVTFTRRKRIVKVVNSKYESIKCFELNNSLPLPLRGGEKTPSDFCVKFPQKMFDEFLQSVKPDVIHVHTLMGLPIEFLRSAHDLEIRVVFTTHDYFGIAPEPTFFWSGKSYIDNNNAEKWAEIGSESLSTWKLRIYQTHWFPIIRILRMKLQNIYQRLTKQFRFLTDSNEYQQIEHRYVNNGITASYSMLKKYYLDELSLVDFFHFNSNVAKKIYFSQNIRPKEYRVVPITHEGISHAPHLKTINPKGTITVGYIAKFSEYKGFSEFNRLASQLQNENIKFVAYGDNQIPQNSNNIQFMGTYAPSDFQSVVSSMDVLIIPSLWYETFGFTTLEALSCGVPVIVHDTVGAKDLADSRFVYHNIEDVVPLISRISTYHILKLPSMLEHAKKMRNIYLGKCIE